MRVASFAVLALLACGPVCAQTAETPPDAVKDAAPAAPPPPAAPQGAGRYSFNRVEAGFLRLDSVSGQVALCSPRSAGWACEAVPEERAALESEIARLQGEVTQLKAEVAALRPSAGPPRPPGDLAPRDPDAKSGFKLPTDEDIAWARARIRHVWRQFVDMVAEMQKDVGK